MKITVNITDEDLDGLQPLMEETHRTAKNYIETLVKAAVSADKSLRMIMLDSIGKIKKRNP